MKPACVIRLHQQLSAKAFGMRYPSSNRCRTVRFTIITLSGNHSSARGFGDQSQYHRQDEIKRQQNLQLRSTELIAKMLSGNSDEAVHAIASDHIDSLTEEFFHTGAAYVAMSQKENNREVEEKITAVMKIAMQVKQSTLRPEIQLLNKLLASTSPTERLQILNPTSAGECLVINDGYFFTLLERMRSDVSKQPNGQELLKKLDEIKKDALQRLPK